MGQSVSRDDLLAQAKTYRDKIREYRELETQTLALARPDLIEVWVAGRFYAYSVEPGTVALNDRVRILGGAMEGAILRVDAIGSYYQGETEPAELYAHYGQRAVT